MQNGTSAFRPKADIAEVILPSESWPARGQVNSRPLLSHSNIGSDGQTHGQMGLPMSNKTEKKLLSLTAVLMTVYVVGFLATAVYYVIRGLIIEALLYALIWPLHWLLEIIEAIAK